MEKLISKIAEEKERLNQMIETFNNERDITISENIYRRISLKEKYIKGLEDALDCVASSIK